MADKNTNWTALSALLLSMLLWSSSLIALKLAFTVYDPMVVIFGRMFVASICFLLLLKNIRKTPYRKGDWKPLVFMAFCEPCLYFIFEALALKNTDASQAGMICALLPLLMAVAARLILKETITRLTLSGFILAVLGAILLSAAATPSEQSPNPVLGNSLEFVAMFCAVGYMITLKKLIERYSPWFLTAVQAWMGAIFYLPLLFLPSTTWTTSFVPVPFFSIIYLGVFITLGAYGLYNFGMSRIPANQASAFVNLIPVFTLILGWTVLGERLAPLQYAGSALVLAGLYLSHKGSKKA